MKWFSWKQACRNDTQTTLLLSRAVNVKTFSCFKLRTAALVGASRREFVQYGTDKNMQLTPLPHCPGSEARVYGEK